MNKFAKLVMTSLMVFEVLVLASCSLAPGMRGLGSSSNQKLPGVNGIDSPPANIKIQKITADLIVSIDRKNKEEIENNRKVHMQINDKVYTYTLDKGDVLSITVWDHPELTIPAGSFRSTEGSGSTVASDGTIYYPYAGVISVKDKSISEVRGLLTEKLSKYIENVMLDVKIIKYRSKRVYVVGQVKVPGIHVIDDLAPTILEMLNRAGGFSEFADRKNITLSRNDVTYRIDMQALYELGNQNNNILLQSGDVLNIWDNKLNKVFVMGEVNQPNSIQMDNQRKSLAEALTDAGGINQTSANSGQIFVVRSHKGKSEIFHLDASTVDAMILAERFPLMPRDVVYVETAFLIKWSRIMSAIAPTVSILNSSGAVNFPLFSNGSN